MSIRQTLKPINSRKTYLVDMYAHLLKSNKVVLALHNSTLLKKDDRQLRTDLLKAGAQLTIVRSNLMKVALRGLKTDDPAAYKPKKGEKINFNPLSSLFVGPSAIITMPELNPSSVEKVVKIIDKTQNKLVLLGGQIDGIEKPIFRDEIDQLCKLPSLPQLQAELAHILSTLAGGALTQTLQASQQKLVLSLEQHAKKD